MKGMGSETEVMGRKEYGRMKELRKGQEIKGMGSETGVMGRKG